MVNSTNNMKIKELPNAPATSIPASNVEDKKD
jgi:hypothetical protein